MTAIRPQSRNANRHTARGMQALETSIATDGWIGAITVAADGETFDGSARVEKTAENGMLDEALVIDIDGTKPVILRRTDIPSATDPRAVRLGIAANRVASLNLEWEPDILASIAESGVDLGSLFTADEWADVAMPSLPEAGGGGDDFDPTPEDGPTRTQVGELWSIGGVHRLLVGDCTIAANVARLMGGERADMVWTDPPYGVEIVGGTHNPYLPSFQSGERIQNDDLSADDLEQLLRSAFNNVFTYCRNGGAWYVAAPAGPLHLVFGKVLNELKIWHQTLQWLKHAFVFGRNDYHYRNEPMFYGWKPGAAHYFTDDRTQDTIWEFDRPGPTDKAHPTVKPIGLVERALSNSSHLGELAVDPFLGSGTTLIAAHRTGRRCYGMELSPKYCDVILRRATAEGLECELISALEHQDAVNVV